jgi:hypothetical protein
MRPLFILQLLVSNLYWIVIKNYLKFKIKNYEAFFNHDSFTDLHE